MNDLSGLRITGFVVGIIGFILTFIIYRGPRWKRKNFLLYGLFSLGLTIVSLNPDILNVVAGMLKLETEQRGRILALLIGSNILMWLFVIFLKMRLDEFRYQFDHLVRNLGGEEARNLLEQGLAGKEIAVVIPAFNEEANLLKLLARMPTQICNKRIGVVVVDDGSTDKTLETVRKLGHLAVRNKINRGQGAASRLGYDILLKHNVEIGVTMDADLQHSPDDLEQMLHPLLNDQFDLVVGSRHAQAYIGSPLRKLGIIFFTRLINLLGNLDLTDCSSGFKAFKVDKIRRLHLREDQFQSAEVILEAAKNGLRIGEVPITILEREHGLSKKGNDFKYGLHFARSIFKSWWRT